MRLFPVFITSTWKGLKQRERIIILGGLFLVLGTALFLWLSKSQQNLAHLKEQQLTLRKELNWIKDQADTLSRINTNCFDIKYQGSISKTSLEQLARNNQLSVTDSQEAQSHYTMTLESNFGSRLLSFAHQASCLGLQLEALSIKPLQSDSTRLTGDFSFNPVATSPSVNDLTLVPSQPYLWDWFSPTTNLTTNRIEEADEELDESNINAELLGVVISPNFSTATLKVNGQPEEIFHVGDELATGVEIDSITPTRIVIDERGRLTQLSMRQYDSVLQEIDHNTQAASQTQAGFALANMFAATPVQVDNFDTGMRLDSLSEEMKMLADMRDGDVVVQIGNEDIQNLLADPSLWTNYSTQTALPVTVIRDGQEVIVNVNVFSLSAQILPNLADELIP